MPIEQTEEQIKQVCNALADFLIGKNRKYGDSALNPKKFFARGESEDLINVRIDDKLNRIFQGQVVEDEDVLKDLVGYWVLREISRMRKGAVVINLNPPDYTPEWKTGDPVYPPQKHDPAQELDKWPPRKSGELPKHKGKSVPMTSKVPEYTPTDDPDVPEYHSPFPNLKKDFIGRPGDAE